MNGVRLTHDDVILEKSWMKKIPPFKLFPSKLPPFYIKAVHFIVKIVSTECIRDLDWTEPW